MRTNAIAIISAATANACSNSGAAVLTNALCVDFFFAPQAYVPLSRTPYYTQTCTHAHMAATTQEQHITRRAHAVGVCALRLSILLHLERDALQQQNQSKCNNSSCSRVG